VTLRRALTSAGELLVNFWIRFNVKAEGQEKGETSWKSRNRKRSVLVQDVTAMRLLATIAASNVVTRRLVRRIAIAAIKTVANLWLIQRPGSD
jgi:hypothetical protein